ncbi:hypothetical protein F5Y09DRAFT_110684 [Xylaria sp. FL1042]|nr:hypothetical protein F5Y09DRAFT_110684 [Xylaria sp. FL1042]
MASTHEQTDEWDGVLLPGPDRCTFLDEMWRAQPSGSQRRYFTKNRAGNLTFIRPVSSAVTSVSDLGHRTAAERASEEDGKLWCSSSSNDDYEQRRQALYEKRRSERDRWMQQQPTFPSFSSLPPELRHHVWKLAMEEPTTVGITVSEHKRNYPPPGSPCGTVFDMPSEFAARAILPPFMLVNHEAHEIASKHYRRAFCGLSGKGGVLAAYPTVLQVETNALDILPLDDFDLVAEIKLTDNDRWGWHLPVEGGLNDKIGKILAVPNLKKFVARVGYYWRNGEVPDLLCFTLRDAFVVATSSTPDMHVPEVELKVTQLRRNGVVYRFRGSVLDLPGEFEK